MMIQMLQAITYCRTSILSGIILLRPQTIDAVYNAPMLASQQRCLWPSGSSSPQISCFPCRCPSSPCSTSSLASSASFPSQMSTDGPWLTVRRSRAKAQVVSSSTSDRLADSSSKVAQQTATPRASSRSQGPEYSLVETRKALQAMLEDLRGVDCIAVDCEGVKLGLKDGGKLCLIQIAARTSGQSSNSNASRGSSSSSSNASSSNSNGTSDGAGVDASVSSSNSVQTSNDSQTADPSSSHKDDSTSSAATRSNSSSNGRSSKSTGPLRTWVVDVVALQWKALYDRTEDKAFSLKSILEDPAVTKLMFDLRSDSAQLSREYGVRLRGAYDLQLAEVATRQLANVVAQWVLPLDKVLAEHLPRTPALQEDITAGMAIARAWHQSNKTEVWEQRPLSEELLRYAATDVRYLHVLEEALNMRLPQLIVEKVRRASAARSIEIPLPGPKRAEAPVIVGKKEFKELLNGPSSNSGNSNRRRPAVGPGPAIGSAPTSSSSNGVAAGTYAAAAGQGSGTSSSNSGQQQGQSKEKEEQPVVTKRSLPPRLTLGGSSTAMAAASGTAGSGTSQSVGGTTAGVGASTSSAPGPVLLQPRKRAEGEEAPLWLYEKFNKMISPKSEAEDEGKAEAATEGQGQEHEEGQVQGDGHEVAPGHHSSNGADISASQPQAAEQAQSVVPAVPPGLLWGSSTIGSSSTAPKANKPELKRPGPPRRPGS